MLGNFWMQRPQDIFAFSLHLLLIYVGFKAQNPVVWRLVFYGMAAISFFIWIYSNKRMFAVSNVATSKIGTAAQGYVELFGKISSNRANWVTSPTTGMACVWYRYIIEQKSGDEWRIIDSGESSMTFEIEDDSGVCVIDPEGAELLACDKTVKRESDRRITEYRLTKTVYVLGEFSTLGGEHHRLDIKSDLAKLLAEWKLDQPQLKARFDKNRDGEIDLEEWEEARKVALHEVRRQHADIRQNTPVVHVMRKPRDKRPYILSSRSPESLHRRLRWQGALHLLIAFAAVFAGLSIH
jgi:hypothetical protein